MGWIWRGWAGVGIALRCMLGAGLVYREGASFCGIRVEGMVSPWIAM